MTDTREHITDPTIVDRGDYRTALALIDAGAVDVATPAGALLAAECAAYRDDVATAEALAEPLALSAWLDDVGARGAVSRRARLILAEVAYSGRRYAECGDLARTVVDAARSAGDEQAAMRAVYCLARIAFRRGGPALAAERFHDVVARAESLGSPYYAGLARYFLAYGRMLADDFDGAAEYWPAALDALEPTQGRWYACALNAHGWFLSERGDDLAALRRFDEGEAILSRLGLVDDLHWIEANRARSLVLLGRTREAVARYGSLVDVARRDGHPAEIPALNWLAVALHELGRYADAVDAAGAMLTLAELVGDEGDRVAARLVGARARVARGDVSATTDLERYAVEADGATDYQRAQAVLYLAEALVASDPTRAAALVDEARAFAVVATAARLRTDLAAAERAIARAAVRVSPPALIINPDLGAVSIEEAQREVARFLFADALRREGDNVERAGARVGLSRAQAFRLARELKAGE